MGKKKGPEESTALTPVSGPPDFSNILSSESLTLAQKRAKILKGTGVRRTKKKYATPDERKEAARSRAKARREQEKKVLEEYGLAPKPKVKKTKEEKKAARSARGKMRRSFFREMVKANPELAKEYGVDPSRMKL